MKLLNLLAIIVFAIAGCSPATDDPVAPKEVQTVNQAPDALLAGEVMAVAYSGFPGRSASRPRRWCRESQQ